MKRWSLAVVLLPIVLLGCPERGTLAVPKPSVSLSTVEHDGHLFVTFYEGSSKGGIVHHPDCPCQKEAE